MTFKTADLEPTTSHRTFIHRDTTRALPPVRVTQNDCDTGVPVRLMAGQALMIELTLDEATGYRWFFEDMPAPRVSVSAVKRRMGDGCMPHLGRGVETYHYLWTAEQVESLGCDFVVTAVLARDARGRGFKRTEFCIRVTASDGLVH